MELVESRRCKKMMVTGGFKYGFAYTTKSKITRWRCHRKNCTASIFVKGTEVIERKGQHGNDCAFVNVDQQQSLLSSVQGAVEDTRQTSRTLILGEIDDRGVSSTATKNGVLKERKHAYRPRRQTCPVNCKCITEVQNALRSMDTTTAYDEEFSMINDITSDMMIFSCNTNLECLCKSETVYVDGTFARCPTLFAQLLAINGLVNGDYVPLVFCLLKDKNVETYQKSLWYVVQKCSDLNLTFGPRTITVDFEVPIRRAVLSVWPSVTIVMCRFNLIRDWYRKIQELGLKSEYKKNDWLKNTFGLPFLNPSEVSDCFSFDFMSDIPDDGKYSQYADYLLENYIDENSEFPPDVWASHTAALNRATNDCKWFYSHFNDRNYKSHPSIFTFINILKDNVQSGVYRKINRIGMKKVRNTAKIKIERNRLLDTEKAIKSYEQNEISRYTFVKTVSSINYVAF